MLDIEYTSYKTRCYKSQLEKKSIGWSKSLISGWGFVHLLPVLKQWADPWACHPNCDDSKTKESWEHDLLTQWHNFRTSKKKQQTKQPQKVVTKSKNEADQSESRQKRSRLTQHLDRTTFHPHSSRLSLESSGHSWYICRCWKFNVMFNGTFWVEKMHDLIWFNMIYMKHHMITSTCISYFKI